MDVLVKAMAQDEPILVVALVDTETVEKARATARHLPHCHGSAGQNHERRAPALIAAQGRAEGDCAGGGGRPAAGSCRGGRLQQCRVRSYIKQPHIHLGLKDGKLDVGRAIGKGFFNVIKDLGLRDYYQGSVPLQTGEIATDLAYYLNNSEQIPAAVSLGVYVETDNAATGKRRLYDTFSPRCR